MCCSSEWNKGELQSFLIEITSHIFTEPDAFDSNSRLLDRILDVAGAKGTGSWTCQEASRRGVPCPTIQAALDMRYISVFKQQRVQASKVFLKPCWSHQEKATLNGKLFKWHMLFPDVSQ